MMSTRFWQVIRTPRVLLGCLCLGLAMTAVGGFYGLRTQPYTARAILRVAHDESAQSASAGLAMQLGLPLPSAGGAGPEFLLGVLQSRGVQLAAMRAGEPGTSWYESWALMAPPQTAVEPALRAFRSQVRGRVEGATGMLYLTAQHQDSVMSEQMLSRWITALRMHQMTAATERLEAKQAFAEAAIDSTRRELAKAEREWIGYVSGHAAYRTVPASVVEATRREQRMRQLHETLGLLERSALQARFDELREVRVFDVIDPPTDSATQISQFRRGVIFGALAGALLVVLLLWWHLVRAARLSPQGTMTMPRLGASALVLFALAGSLASPQSLVAQQATPASWSLLRQQVEQSGRSWTEAEARLRQAGVMTDTNQGPSAIGDSMWVRATQALGPDSPALTSVPAVKSTAGPDLPIFGSALTSGGWDADRVVTSWPIDDSYHLGPGDELTLILAGEIDAAQQLVVTREGRLIVPRVGAIAVGGRAMRDVRVELIQRLRRVYGSVGETETSGTTASLTLTRPRTIAVLVSGAVRRPGLITIPGSGQVLHAVLAAGGILESGSLRQITIMRPGVGVIGGWDAYELLLQADASQPALQAGDVVRVPSRGALVSIVGGVNQPSRVEVLPGEPLSNLLAAAGGLAPGAEGGTATRIGRGPSGYISTTWRRGEWGLASLQPGDSVIVTAAAADTMLSPTIKVEGSFWAPGTVAWKPGVRLAEVIAQANGLRPDALEDRLLVYRRAPDGSETQFRARWDAATGTPIPNLLLEPMDRIEAFSAARLQVSLPVRVDGAVRAPSAFPFRAGMSARDAVLMAGGMLPEAYPDSIEITRSRRGEGGDLLGVAERMPFLRMLPGSLEPGELVDEIALSPGDHLTVLRHPYWAGESTVTLLGEVVSPGTYAVTRRSERISDIIGRAGGLRDIAYPGGVRIRRVGIGEININLPKVLRDPRHRDNLVLAHGDTIVVPPYVPVIRVRGEVQQPTAVAYVPGKNVDYYIRAAGGATPKGDKGRAFVQQANGTIQTARGRFLFADYRPEPLAGATVIVPERPEQRSTNWSSILGSVTGILGSIITLVVVSSR